jgi:hypothetical protein
MRQRGSIAVMTSERHSDRLSGPAVSEPHGWLWPSTWRRLTDRSVTTMRSLISRYDGDVERALTSRRPHRQMTFEGQVFPHRKALAKYLAPRLQRPARSVEGLLLAYNDDIAAVLAAKPYRQRSP